MMPPIENLLSARPEMFACAGAALGIDRLHPWLVQAASISEGRVFPYGRA